jgi:ribonuclease D
MNLITPPPAVLHQPIIWLTSDDQIKAYCEKWLRLDWIVLDTEFMRTDTFYPIPALIQINDGNANYLIDPLEVKNLASFRDVLLAENVQKVLHSCSEDLEVFQSLVDCVPQNIFDTQIAAAFCGYGFSKGYGNLVNAILNIHLPKDETRSDWLRRPLSDAQQQYAALDVEYLYLVAQQLKTQLTEHDRQSWVTDECAQLVENFLENQDSSNALQRFRSAWRLNSRQLFVLANLASWRDQLAQTNNRVRSQIVADKDLYAIAEVMPSHVSQLRQVTEMPEKSIRQLGEQIIEIILDLRKVPDSELPQRLPRPPSGAQQSLITRMRDQMTLLGEQLKIAPEYLARRKDYEFIVRAQQEGKIGDDLFPCAFSGWRAEWVKPVLQKFL